MKLFKFALILALMPILYAESKPPDWKESARIKQILTTEGDKAGLPIGLAHCVAYTESRFIPTARSKVVNGYRSCGLMQIYRKYINHLVSVYSSDPKNFDWTDPEDNAEIGCKYLKYLIDRFGGSVWLGICAYNMGETDLAHIKSLDDIPQNCRDYADSIVKLLDNYDESW